MLNLWQKTHKKFAKDKYHRKVTDHCHYTGKYRGAGHNICNLKFNVLNELPVAFYNGSNYYYHFIIKKLAKKCKEQFKYLRENTEKYTIFLVPKEKEITQVDKNGNGKFFIKSS